MAQMRMSTGEAEDFFRDHPIGQDAGYGMYSPTRADYEEEQDRRRDVDEEIDRGARQVEDRQSRDYWNERNREKEAEFKKERERIAEKEKAREDLKKKAVNFILGGGKPQRKERPAPRREPARRYSPAPRYERPAPSEHGLSVFGMGSYADPFGGIGFGSMMADRARRGSIFEGYSDPFTGGFRTGAPGRGSALDIRGSIFDADPFSGMIAAPAPRRAAPKRSTHRKKARR